jgi:hypothetical protein
MPDMNICFISNYYKTYFFHEIARVLEQNGIQVFWITVDNRYRSFLEQHYPAERILHLGKERASMPQPPVGDFKLNELVHNDRVLSRRTEWSYDYLKNIQKPAYDFLKARSIRYLFGEITWAHEILLHRIASRHPELGCRFYNPHTIRIPNGRFGFFTDEYQSVLVPAGQESQEASSEKPSIKIEKPDYLHKNDLLIKEKNSLKGKAIRTLNFILDKNHDDPNDPTRLTKLQTVQLRLQEDINRLLYRSVKRIRAEELENRPFAFITLHKQPEASIDVLGRYYENQLTNIVNIWRIIPEDWLLVIKEHTNALGDRDLAFYNELRNYRNIVFVDEKLNSLDLVKKCRLVATVSGTIAYEAVLCGKRALTFADCFFNNYGSCYRVSLDDLKHCDNVEHLFSMLEARHGKARPAEDLSGYVLGHSFPGMIGDSWHNAEGMQASNIAKVADAFLKVIR